MWVSPSAMDFYFENAVDDYQKPLPERGGEPPTGGGGVLLHKI